MNDHSSAHTLDQPVTPPPPAPAPPSEAPSSEPRPAHGLPPHAQPTAASASQTPESPRADEVPDAAASSLEPVIVVKEPAPREPESQTPAATRSDGPRIIALMNQKGGVGKTTTCVNLGAALARLGYKVLLIDLDPQAHLTLHVGVDPETLDASIYDLLTDPQVSALSIAHEVADRLGVLPAEVNLAGVESELADKVISGVAQTVLREKCAEFCSHFDYVLMDCPPSLGLLTINALTMAQEVIVPMQAHFLALQGLSKLLETVNLVRQGINPGLKVSGVIICMHESNTILAGEVVKDLKQFFAAGRGTDVPWREAVLYQPSVRRNIKLAESPSFGQSIFDYAADCKGAEDYAKLARSVAAHRVTG